MSTWGSVFIPPGFPGDALFGGDHRPRPSDWEKFPVQARVRRYFFRGEYRNPSQQTWNSDSAVGHSYDIYENGTLSRVGWDDTWGDMDMNDLIVEVAVVDRTGHFDDFVAADTIRCPVELHRRRTARPACRTPPIRLPDALVVATAVEYKLSD